LVTGFLGRVQHVFSSLLGFLVSKSDVGGLEVVVVYGVWPGGQC
jgi:hypothetical protein